MVSKLCSRKFGGSRKGPEGHWGAAKCRPAPALISAVTFVLQIGLKVRIPLKDSTDNEKGKKVKTIDTNY